MKKSTIIFLFLSTIFSIAHADSKNTDISITIESPSQNVMKKDIKNTETQSEIDARQCYIDSNKQRQCYSDE